LQRSAGDCKCLRLARVLWSDRVRLFHLLRIQLTEVDELRDLDGVLRKDSQVGEFARLNPGCTRPAVLVPFTISLCAPGPSLQNILHGDNDGQERVNSFAPCSPAIGAPLYDVGVLSDRGLLPGLDGIPQRRFSKTSPCSS
jgi:hypothetical protein